MTPISSLIFVIVIYCLIGYWMVQIIKHQIDHPKGSKPKFNGSK